MQKLVPVFLSFFFLLFFRPTASADIYIRINGVTGASLATGFNGFFEVGTTGLANGICTTGTGSCAPPPPEFVFSMDDPTGIPPLQERMLMGTITSRVDVVFTSSSPSGPQTYYQIRLDNVKIQSIAEVGNSNGVPSQQYTVKFEKIGWKAVTYGKDGVPNGNKTFCWDYTGRGNSSCTSSYFNL